LLKILIRRYSNNLSTEQLSPVISWVYASYSFSILLEFIRTKIDISDKKIATDEGIGLNIEHIEIISIELTLTLNTFKYEGRTISSYCDNSVIEQVKAFVTKNLARDIGIEREMLELKRIADKATMVLVDKIQKENEKTTIH
jgi:hypothetical protein